MYQVIITDLNNHSIVDIYPKRDMQALIQYLKPFSKYSNSFTEGYNNNIKVLKLIKLWAPSF